MAHATLNLASHGRLVGGVALFLSLCLVACRSNHTTCTS
jgi:hypothetical protein